MMRTMVLMVATLLSFAVLAACGEVGDEAAAPPDLRLDPATLAVTTAEGDPAELTEFRRAEHVYAGAVDEDLFIAVALDEDFATGDPQDVLVYLCDDEDIWLYLGGQIDDQGAVTFDVAAGNVRGVDEVTLGEDLSITLAVATQEATGELTIADEDPRPFVARIPEEGTNVGFFTARTDTAGSAHRPGWALADPDYVGGWVILNPTYRVRGAITLGSAVSPVETYLSSTTTSMH